MQPSQFILATMSHVARGDDGPPPGVPLHVDTAFETGLAALCVEQRVSPVVARALARNALPTSISRITMARLETHAAGVESESSRRQALARRVVDALGGAGVGALIMGNVQNAQLYPVPELRAVNSIDILVRPKESPRALACLGKIGFVVSGPSPLVAAGTTDLNAGRARDVVRYHLHFAPLTVVNAQGDRVHLHFRVTEFGGEPYLEETAWKRSQRMRIAGGEVPALGREDALLFTVMMLGVAALQSLPLLQDVGLMLTGQRLDMSYVRERALAQGVYSPFQFIVRHVRRALRLTTPRDAVELPPMLPSLVLERLWQPTRIDYDRGLSGSRFRFGFVCCGGLVSRTRWLWRHVTPRASWVHDAFGNASPWSWVKFMLLMRATYDIPVLGAFGTIIQRNERDNAE